MKKITSFILILFCVGVSSTAFAKAGPEIPNPTASMSEAIRIAEIYFYSKETRMSDPETFKREDYILMSAEYTDEFQAEGAQDWVWKIKFVHPKQNDHSVTYKVGNDKTLTFISATE